MPHSWGNKVVVTWHELVPKYFSEPALKSAVNRYKEKPYGIKKLVTGGNGRVALIDFDSLPYGIQQSIGDIRLQNHVLEAFYKIDAGAVAYYSRYMQADGTYLRSVTQEKYIVNASVLKAAIELREQRLSMRDNLKGSHAGIMKTLAADVASFNDVLQAKHKVAHNLPENHRRFIEKFNRFVAEGYTSLIQDLHGARKNNATKTDSNTVTLLNCLFAKQAHKPSAAEIAVQYVAFVTGRIKVVNTDTGEEYNPSEFPMLSERTIYAYLAKWENRSVNETMRSGDRLKQISKYKTPHSLERPKLAGSILSIDDRNPPFEYATGKRVWFYNGIDLASEAITCYVWGESKEGIILEFYRQLVRNYTEWNIKLPFELECESSLNSSYRNTLLREGVMFQSVRIESANARGKKIERYFGSLRYGIEKEREGWIARPFAKRESNQSSPGKTKVIDFDVIVQNALQDIETWNNMPNKVFPDKSRWDVFMEFQDQTLPDTNWPEVLRYIGHRTFTSCRTGEVNLNNGKYLLAHDGEVATGPKLIELMSRVESKEFDVLWLDGNDGKIIKAFAYDKEGRLLTELVAKPSYQRAKNEQTAQDLLKREVMSKYVASVEGYIRTQKHTRDNIAIIGTTTKTIGQSFKIAGLKRYQPEPQPEEMVEILEAFDDLEIVSEQSQSQSPSWKDRFSI